MSIDRNELRALVREVVRDAVAGLNVAQRPAPTPTPTPPPPPPPPTQFSGQLTACGQTWCVGGEALDWGSAAKLSANANADFDGDGTVESNRDELTGLQGTSVVAHVQQGTKIVTAIGPRDY